MGKTVGKGSAAAMDHGKPDRVLLLYEQLRAGKAVNKAEAAGEYGVTERSIQRDIGALRVFFSEQAAQRGVSAEIVYDRGRKGLVLEGVRDPIMTNSKILLESRAFRKEDMASLLDRLPTAEAVSREERGAVVEAEIYGKGILACDSIGSIQCRPPTPQMREPPSPITG